jgi:hypothetical protein
MLLTDKLYNALPLFFFAKRKSAMAPLEKKKKDGASGRERDDEWVVL